MRAVYVSYDGALDPLGASQVVPYLLGLGSRGVRLTLISFEKTRSWASRGTRSALGGLLRSAGIRWVPLRYHKRPRLPATLWDVFRGARVVRAEARWQGAEIVHCRGDVAMAMARAARLGPAVRLLYDKRGFYSDERVEGGSWAAGGVLDRTVRRLEAGNLRCAAGLVVLTQAARRALLQPGSDLPPHRVIPTCVDPGRFVPRSEGEEPQYGLVYSGSLGSFYLTDQMVAFAREASKVVPGRVLFLSREGELARAAGASSDWADVTSAAPDEVPAWLRRARALFFFCRLGPSKAAAYPTKIGEALATGLPVLVNSGIGDLDELLQNERVGIVLESFSHRAYEGAALRLARLLRDPDTQARCRRFAEQHLSVAQGVEAYHDLYRELASRSSAV